MSLSIDKTEVHFYLRFCAKVRDLIIHFFFLIYRVLLEIKHMMT